jgi:hypothetical protein
VIGWALVWLLKYNFSRFSATMSRAASPTPSTSSEASLSEEIQKKLLDELLQKAVKACTMNTATDEASEEEVLTLTGEDDLP